MNKFNFNTFLKLKPGHRISLLLLLMTFLSFLILDIILISGKNSNTSLLKVKGEKIANAIISSTDRSLFNNRAAFRADVESFFANRDIAEIVITDSTGREIINYVSNFNHTKTLTMKKYYYTHDNLRCGMLKLVVSNHSSLKKYEAISESLISSNLEYLWDYDKNSMIRSINNAFKDEDITNIKIKDQRGYILAERSRSSSGAKEHTIIKSFVKNSKGIGTLEITFKNSSIIKTGNTDNIFLMIFMTITFLSAISIVMLINNIFSKTGKIPASKDSLSWNISQSTEDKLKKAMTYIDENYSRNISREGLAHMVGLNKDNLGRYFSKYTGEKITDYVNRLRIEDAADRILNTDENITNIAFAVGFENISTFYRIFTRIKHVPPTEFRKTRTSK